MMSRSLIVLLVTLNVGVALWWMLQGAPATPTPPLTLPGGVPGLRLQTEADVGAKPVAAAHPVFQPVGSGLCYAFGPLLENADPPDVQKFAVGVPRLTPRPAEPMPKAWRVVMPPTAEPVAQTQQRLIAAGFTDLLPVTKGEESGTIALGRFGSREAAIRHQTALAEKGFPAQVQPADGSVQPSVTFQLLQGANADQVRVELQVLRAEPVDCVSLAQ